jgi:hypothetical protein
LCDKRINISIHRNKLELSFDDNGQTKKIFGSINSHISNKRFDIVCRVIDSRLFYKTLTQNHIFFVFNNSNTLINDLHKNLVVNPVDENAKTIEISFTHFNPRLCYDVVNSVLNVYLSFEKDSKQTKANKTIAFINQQLDSLSKVLQISKDSLNSFQRIEKIPDIDRMGESFSNNIDDLTRKLIETDDELLTLRQVYQKLNSDPNRIELYKLIPEMLGKKSFEESIIRQI